MSSLAAIICLVLLCGAAYGGTFPATSSPSDSPQPRSTGPTVTTAKKP